MIWATAGVMVAVVVLPALFTGQWLWSDSLLLLVALGFIVWDAVERRRAIRSSQPTDQESLRDEVRRWREDASRHHPGG